MSNPLALIQLAEKASSVATLLEADLPKDEAAIAAVVADAEKLFADLKTLEETLVAAAKAAGVTLPAPKV